MHASSERLLRPEGVGVRMLELQALMAPCRGSGSSRIFDAQTGEGGQGKTGAASGLPGVEDCGGAVSNEVGHGVCSHPRRG